MHHFELYLTLLRITINYFQNPEWHVFKSTSLFGTGAPEGAVNEVEVKVTSVVGFLSPKWSLSSLSSQQRYVICYKLLALLSAIFMAGIYLLHNDYCLPEYTVISDIALTADNPLQCILVGSTGTVGGQWTGPNTTVLCGNSTSSSPFNCSQSSDPTNITLYKTTGASFSGRQSYTCTISGQSITVQIKSETIYINYPFQCCSEFIFLQTTRC